MYTTNCLSQLFSERVKMTSCIIISVNHKSSLSKLVLASKI